MLCTTLVYIKNIWGDLYSMLACRCFCGCMSSSVVCIDDTWRCECNATFLPLAQDKDSAVPKCQSFCFCIKMIKRNNKNKIKIKKSLTLFCAHFDTETHHSVHARNCLFLSVWTNCANAPHYQLISGCCH